MSTLELPPKTTHAQTGDENMDRVQRERDRIAQQFAHMPFANGIAVLGVDDSTQFRGQTDGISFTAGQAREIKHGLGRRPLGFMIINATGEAPQLYRDDANLTTGLETSHLRLVRAAGAAGTSTVKLWVF